MHPSPNGQVAATVQRVETREAAVWKVDLSRLGALRTTAEGRMDALSVVPASTRPPGPGGLFAQELQLQSHGSRLPLPLPAPHTASHT